jgi:hypothetical protein
MAVETSRFTLRIHPLVMKKMKVIADYNGRSVNKEIEQILKWVIDDFENKCGKIRTEELNLIDHPERKMRPKDTNTHQPQTPRLFKL